MTLHERLARAFGVVDARFEAPRSGPFATPDAPRLAACLAAVAVALATLIGAPSAAGAPVADDELPAAVGAALRRAQIPDGAVGVFVQRAGAADRPFVDAAPGPRSVARAAQPLLSLHAGIPMNPASTMKLVTTYAALEMLGPAFTWKTVLASSAAQDGSTLDGDLYLRGAGDPKLVYEHLWLMLRQLRGRGIRAIRGDLVLDRTLFEIAPYDPAAFDGEPARPYNVGPDALLVNYKAVTLRFLPDDARHEVRIAAEPPLAGLSIGPIAYADGPCGDWRQRAAPDFGRRDAIAFAGAYAGSCGEQTWNVAIYDHRDYIGALVRALWTELGGTLSGVVRDGAMPPDARVLVEHESPSLAEVVRDVNKYSNNVMARELFLSLSAEATRAPANTSRAQRVLRGFYDAKGLAMRDLVVDNGSGLSRSERISAASMGAVLDAAWSSPVMPEFVASLPLAGFDGTMRRRLNQRPVAGQAHIKTGSLADVRAAAGYVLAASGRYYIVVMFVNHPNAGGAQAAQDALLEWVYDRG